MASNKARRGEIWTATLGVARSGELGKTRPVVVMTIDDIMTDGDDELLIVVPLSSSRASSLLRPEVPAGNGIVKDSVAVVRGARAIARDRLQEKVSALDPAILQQITMLLTLTIGGQPRMKLVP